MKEKITIQVSAANKSYIKRRARQTNKTMSQFINDLVTETKKQPAQKTEYDEWIEKTAGSYNTGHADILNDLFKDMKKR